MRTSQYFLATFREVPAEAELISHQLMLRSTMIRKLASGLYSWLPLGFRVLHKVETIVREEMERAGALEILMPAVQPKELWEQTERWEQYGNELLKLNDRHDREFCFGPTHEEVITSIIRDDIRSYKQLPCNLYQVQTKFRDEIRPRFGVMRSREFLMKDAYSFDIDAEGLNQSYQIMYDAYMRIFTRLGLNFRAVLADSGSIGGNMSQEFQVLAESGEDAIFYSDGSDYAANVELAEAVAIPALDQDKELSLEEVETPGKKTTAEVSEFLKLPEAQTVKIILVKGTDSAAVGLLLRGGHTLNMHKAEKHPAVAVPLELLSEAEVLTLCECPAGYIGPLDLNIPLLVDRSAANIKNFVCGANLVDKHLKHVNWERDVPLPEVVDMRNVEVGDPSPDGKGTLQTTRGIEVGHIFQLGDKYSKALKATVLGKDGKATQLQMGCYGIGISRIVAAAIEQNHDDNGIIWPEAIAPFQVALIPINLHKSHRVKDACDALYEKLTAAGLDVLYDDRRERPGVIFADMDLIGIPHHIVISEKHLDAGEIEYKSRRDQEKQMMSEDALMDLLNKL